MAERRQKGNVAVLKQLDLRSAWSRRKNRAVRKANA